MTHFAEDLFLCDRMQTPSDCDVGDGTRGDRTGCRDETVEEKVPQEIRRASDAVEGRFVLSRDQSVRAVRCRRRREEVAGTACENHSPGDPFPRKVLLAIHQRPDDEDGDHFRGFRERLRRVADILPGDVAFKFRSDRFGMRDRELTRRA